MDAAVTQTHKQLLLLLLLLLVSAIADPLDSSLSQLTLFGGGDACTTPCAGDTRMVCGGQQQANVYLENDATPEVTPPNDYTPVGCYK